MRNCPDMNCKHYHKADRSHRDFLNGGVLRDYGYCTKPYCVKQHIKNKSIKR